MNQRKALALLARFTGAERLYLFALVPENNLADDDINLTICVGVRGT